MASGSSRRRRRRDSADDNEISHSQASDSPKRPRLSEPSHQSQQVNGTGAGTNGIVPKEVDMSAFSPGAIVRVTVENFVTYEKADFFPGPYLNMVIGPNGTGKSSLVCAICLGLGYSPRHLGRAGSVKEFVKHGKDVATIEIELFKRPQDRRNYTIKVQIRREQNSQKWWLNGKETTHKNIHELMRKLKIQVDNLCQFLPQDRVVEFAGCTPVDLLHETLRAAAPEEMLEWQAELRELYKEKKGITEDAHADSETLQNLESRQQGLQADVDRLRERQEIQDRIENLGSALIMTRYQEARDKFSQAKERKAVAEAALKRLQQESGPSLEAVNDKQAYAEKIKTAIAAKEKELENAQKTARALASQVKTNEEAVSEMGNKLEAERKVFDSRKKDVATSRSKITAIQADLKNRPPDFNAGEWNQKIRAEEHNLRELEANQREITTNITSLREKGKGVNLRMQTLQSSIESFDTQEGQQLNMMKKFFPEVAKGWDWIQDHQDEFEKEVFGPPMITCSVKDERYSDQIQSLMQVDDFTCFTAQTRGDYKKLTDQLYRVMSLSVVVRSCANPLSSYKSPINETEVASLGLDGFAIDFLEGPAPVIAMLCAEKRLHQSGVSLHDQDDSQYESLVNNGKVSQWAAGRQSFTVRRRREYGPQAMTTITKNIQPGRFWTSQPVDTQEKAELNRQLSEARSERNELKVEHVELQGKSRAIDDQKDEIVKKIDGLKNEKNVLQKEYQKWQSLPDKLESEESQRDAHANSMSEARKRMTELQYEWDDAVVGRAKTALRHKESITLIRDSHVAVVEAKICLIEANSDVGGLKDRNADVMRQLEEEKVKLDEAKDETNRARESGRALGAEVKDMLQRNEDKKDLLSGLAEGKSPDEITMEMDAEAAQLELIHAANPNVIREFEKRAQEIDRLKRKMEGTTNRLGGLTAQLEEVMGKWEPKLDELISQINDAFAYNFEQISCAGEVRVRKDEDFEQWALDIMVRFRENEHLQQLTAHRQSGGERAVSTIFFLMALQSMAQSPFRVVDEINQGMDPRNERMVHERMVEIACREHTSQYFLITPKLLTGLRYDPKMRVLCIASGGHMPREGRKLDFRRCLDIQRRLAAAA